MLSIAAVSPSSLRAGVYIRLMDTGTYELTNEPDDRSFKLITGNRSQEAVNETDRAVDLANGKYSIPESLIFSIIKNSRDEAGGAMGLSPELRKSLTDTDVQDTQENILAGTRHLKKLLTQFNGNLTLTLGAYYAGTEVVEKEGGLPNQETRTFVDNVHKAFSQIENRDEIIYTYRNKEGILTVVNITPK